MFYHKKQLQYYKSPDRPNAVYAKQLQELIGGTFGEMSVMMQYLFQGWNCRGPAKYRDMLLDIGTEEIGHIEILSTLIAQLLDKAPLKDQENGAEDPLVGVAMGGGNVREAIASYINPQHLIVSGQGAMAADSVGNPWTSRVIVSSGNLMADFRSNLHAESQGRLQAVRLYEMTDDAGVRDTLSFLIARDTMHQNQWLAALEQLKEDGLDDTPVPSAFPQELEKTEFSYQFWNHSEGQESAEGRWAKGRSIDGKGEFEYVANPQPLSDAPKMNPGEARLYSTNPTPQPEKIQADKTKK